MHITQTDEVYCLYKEESPAAAPIGSATLNAGHFTAFEISPAWQNRGYGSYLLKEILRQNHAFEKTAATTFTAPTPQTPAAAALLAKYGFTAQNRVYARTRVPDYTAVRYTHDFLAAHLSPGGLYVDATCGNGHDTAFLCSLAGANGRVLAFDIQPAAVAATTRRLTEAGYAATGRAILASHADLLNYVTPGTADCVVFNFGWLPGAAHGVYSTPASTLPALQAALTALKPGGVLAACLYSGKEIGDGEKRAVLAFLEGLPLRDYTVLTTRFANWADTAPLPCFVLKRTQKAPSDEGAVRAAD